MKQRLYQFMYGRNGVDQYSRFTVYLSLILFIISMILKDSILGSALRFVAVLWLIYGYFRIFSKNLSKRREENARFVQSRMKFTNGFRNWRDRLRQRRDYVFFRCPSCRAMLRVPRGKGKIRVTCRKCGTAFERKT